MATLNVVSVDVDGELLAPVAAAGGGDVFANDGRTVLYVKNTDAATKTVTVAAQRACSFGTLTGHDAVMTVAQNEEKVIGPFNQTRFNNASQQCAVTYSGVTGVTVAAVRVP